MYHPDSGILFGTYEEQPTARQLNVMHQAFLGKWVDPKIFLSLGPMFGNIGFPPSFSNVAFRITREPESRKLNYSRSEDVGDSISNYAIEHTLQKSSNGIFQLHTTIGSYHKKPLIESCKPVFWIINSHSYLNGVKNDYQPCEFVFGTNSGTKLAIASYNNEGKLKGVGSVCQSILDFAGKDYTGVNKADDKVHQYLYVDLESNSTYQNTAYRLDSNELLTPSPQQIESYRGNPFSIMSRINSIKLGKEFTVPGREDPVRFTIDSNPIDNVIRFTQRDNSRSCAMRAIFPLRLSARLLYNKLHLNSDCRLIPDIVPHLSFDVPGFTDGVFIPDEF